MRTGHETWRQCKNNAFHGLIILFSAILFLPLAAIIFHILKNGLHVLSWEFLTALPKPMGESGGGVGNAIAGTLLLIVLSSLIAIPIGIFTGVYLSENTHGKFSHIIHVAVDMLQGTPSIVIGIAAYIWIVKPMGHFSAFSGGVALALMMLPVIIKSTEETLKRIPNTLKEAALALGAPYYRTMLQIIIPTGFQGILTGVLLGIARVSGESAPLLFTAFGNPFLNLNMNKTVQALPLLIFNYATSPYEDWQAYAWGSSCLLLIFILSLTLLTKAIRPQ